MQAIFENTRFRPNPFFRLRLGSPVQCDLLLEGVSVKLPDPRYLRLLGSLDVPLLRDALVARATWALEVDWSEAETVIAGLIERRVLVDAAESPPQLPAVRHWIKRGWLDALMLHLSTRNLPFADDRAADPDAHNADACRFLVDQQAPPAFWKTWPDRPSIALPESDPTLFDRPLQDVLLARRSNRPWKRGYMSLRELASLLHGANVETRRLRCDAEVGWREHPEILLNSAFSAIESYFFAFEVEGLSPGLYHYDPLHHRAALVRAGVLRDELVRMCIGQSRPHDAACAFVLSAVWDRYMYRYRHSRAYRTLLINISELAQKYIVLATALDLSTFLSPALRDEYADELMGMQGDQEAALYVVAVG